MSTVDIANAYAMAIRIVYEASIDCHEVKAVWEKLNRVKQYLETQADSELAEVLK